MNGESLEQRRERAEEQTPKENVKREKGLKERGRNELLEMVEGSRVGEEVESPLSEEDLPERSEFNEREEARKEALTELGRRTIEEYKKEKKRKDDLEKERDKLSDTERMELQRLEEKIREAEGCFSEHGVDPEKENNNEKLEELGESLFAKKEKLDREMEETGERIEAARRENRGGRSEEINNYQESLEKEMGKMLRESREGSYLGLLNFDEGKIKKERDNFAKARSHAEKWQKEGTAEWKRVEDLLREDIKEEVSKELREVHGDEGFKEEELRSFIDDMVEKRMEEKREKMISDKEKDMVREKVKEEKKGEGKNIENKETKKEIEEEVEKRMKEGVEGDIKEKAEKEVEGLLNEEKFFAKEELMEEAKKKMDKKIKEKRKQDRDEKKSPKGRVDVSVVGYIMLGGAYVMHYGGEWVKKANDWFKNTFGSFWK